MRKGDNAAPRRNRRETGGPVILFFKTYNIFLNIGIRENQITIGCSSNVKRCCKRPTAHFSSFYLLIDGNEKFRSIAGRYFPLGFDQVCAAVKRAILSLFSICVYLLKRRMFVCAAAGRRRRSITFYAPGQAGAYAHSIHHPIESRPLPLLPSQTKQKCSQNRHYSSSR